MRPSLLLLALAGGLAVAPAATAAAAASSQTQQTEQQQHQQQQQQPWSAALLGTVSVPSTIAPAQEPSCSELLLQAAALRCRQVAGGARLVVTLCSEQLTDGDAAQGLLLLQPAAAQAAVAPAAAAAAAGQSVFRLRIVGGPEVLLLPLQYCSGGLAVGAYRLTLPGSYRAEVLQLYDRFSYAGSTGGAAPRLLPAPMRRAATFGLRVGGAALAAAGAHACAPGGACPPCSSHSALGRWVVSGAEQERRALTDALAATCVHGAGSGCEQRLRAALVAAHNHTSSSSSKRPTLAWQPYACRYRRVRGASCRARLEAAGRAVCFVGDANAARMHVQLARMLQGHALPPAVAATAAAAGTAEAHGPKHTPKRAQDSSGTDVGGTSRSAAAAAQLLRFVPLGGETAAGASNSSNASESVLLAPEAAHQLRGCGWVFASHGEQPRAGSSSSSSSSSSSFAGLLAGYAAQLELLARQLLVVQRVTGATPLWLTAPARPLTQAHVDGADSIADPQLLLLNKLAATIMHGHSIGIVDTHSISAPLSDLPLDAAHVVAAAEVQMLANIVCAGAGGAESGR